MGASKNQQQNRLKPILGLCDAVAINIGAIVGAGIFVVTGIASGYAGSALAVSMLIAAVISLFTALSFSELASWQPREGSIYEYAYQLISPFVGFLTGWMWVISNTFAGSAVALGFAHYFCSFFTLLPPNWVAASLCALFTILNFLGARESAFLNNILVAAKLGILGFFVIYGMIYVDFSNFIPFNPFQWGVLSGAFYIFFAYGGLARVAVIAEEVKDAKRNVPRAILISLTISTIVYILVGLVSVGLIGADKLAEAKSPLIEAIGASKNPLAVYIVSAGGLIATASVLLTTILGVSRMAYAMARREDLPRVFGKLHSKYNTPHYSIGIFGVVMILLVLLIDIASVVAVSNFALLFYYTLTNVAALKLKIEKRRYTPIVSFFGAITCMILLVFTALASLHAFAIGGATLAAGAIAHRLFRRFRLDSL